jgi:hypothetical protein
MQHTVPQWRLVQQSSLFLQWWSKSWQNAHKAALLTSMLFNMLIFILPTSWLALYTGGLSWENCYSPSYTKRYLSQRMTKVQYRVHKSSQMDPNINPLNQMNAPIAKISELPLQRKIISWTIRKKPVYTVLIFNAKYVKTVSHSFA